MNWRQCRWVPERAMAPHSSTLAWKIPWMEEPSRLQSMGSLRVRHYWATSLSLLTFMHWRRKWQLTPVFLPGESQGQESQVGWCLWGRTESDTTEVTAAAHRNAAINIWMQTAQAVGKGFHYLPMRSKLRLRGRGLLLQRYMCLFFFFLETYFIKVSSWL